MTFVSWSSQWSSVNDACYETTFLARFLYHTFLFPCPDNRNFGNWLEISGARVGTSHYSFLPPLTKRYMKSSFVSGFLWRWLVFHFMHFETSHFKNSFTIHPDPWKIIREKALNKWLRYLRLWLRLFRYLKKRGKTLEEDSNTQMSLQTSLYPSVFTVLALYGKENTRSLREKRCFL